MFSKVKLGLGTQTLEDPIIDPHCGQQLTLEEAKSLWGARIASLRQSNMPGTGRPRKEGERCPCGTSTLTRARARVFDCCRGAGVAPDVITAAKAAKT